ITCTCQLNFLAVSPYSEDRLATSIIRFATRPTGFHTAPSCRTLSFADMIARVHDASPNLSTATSADIPIALSREDEAVDSFIMSQPPETAATRMRAGTDHGLRALHIWLSSSCRCQESLFFRGSDVARLYLQREDAETTACRRTPSRDRRKPMV